MALTQLVGDESNTAGLSMTLWRLDRPINEGCMISKELAKTMTAQTYMAIDSKSLCSFENSYRICTMNLMTPYIPSSFPP